jgi:hypothetical protein
MKGAITTKDVFSPAQDDRPEAQRPAQRHDVHIVRTTTRKKTKSSIPRPRRTGQNSSYGVLVAKSEDITRLIEAMVDGGGARAEGFFVAHGLGLAYDSVSKGWGIRKHVNAALLQAERDGRQDEIVEAGLEAYDLTAGELASTKRTSSGGIVPQISVDSRVFISHASADKELADALADLIRLGTGLSHERILCTSLEGMGIPVGTTNYLEYLREQLSGAGLVLPLFTPAFFDSEVCLIEIGAMWGLQMPAFPLLVPPVDYGRVEKFLGKFQGAKIEQSAGLSQLHDRIVRTFSLKAETSMWEEKKTRFDKRLPSLLKSLAESTRVDANDLKAAKRRTTEIEAQVAGLEAKFKELEEQNRALHTAKTADEADAAMAPKDEIEQFDELSKAAAETVRLLSRAVRLALYEDLGRSEYYRPDAFSSDAEDAERAQRDDLLAYDEDDGGYTPNYDDPAMGDAREALVSLLHSHWSDDFEQWFRTKYRKRWAANSLPVWDALKLV